jgi:hypothetical protein
MDKFLKNFEVSNFMKIRPVRAELFHANRGTKGRTNLKKLTVAFRSSAKEPGNKINDTGSNIYRNVVSIIKL